MEDTTSAIQIRRGEDRGATRLPWLDSRHSFSFGGHRDPAWMGFRDLLVINDDRVAPGAGFAMHGHRDMEIVSLVLEGALLHRDDLGHASVIRAGEVQRMTAGSGVHHEEHNASDQEAVRFLQIWVRPDRASLPPSWEQRDRRELPKRSDHRLLVSGDPDDGAATWQQDAELWELALPAGGSSAIEPAPGRHAFAHVVSGSVSLGGAVLSAGDAAALSDTHAIHAAEASQVLVFDLA